MAQSSDEPPKKKKCGKSLCHLLNIRSGTVDLPGDEEITLTVGSRSMNIMNVTLDDYAYLDSNLDVAYYGQEDKKITDTDVRKSKHTKTFNINLNIRTILKNIKVEGYIDQYKLNYYKTGDFFLSHRDTNRRGLMGTFILLLPSEYIGGELCFGDYNAEEHLDKSTLRFIYFNGELEHSVTKVLSGHRLSLVYNIYNSRYHQNNIIEPAAVNIHFPDEYYKELLDYTIEYCNGKKNILLGHYKHRNDVFKRLLNDIGNNCKVITVSVDRKSPISTIETVYTLYSPDPNIPESEFDEFDDLIENEYDVRHTLFADNGNLKKDSIEFPGYAGNSPEYYMVTIEHYTAYLINPDRPRRRS
ncbi:uncharacterized protein LOC122852103 [Aphidius gifuensis]|uniref:uncharacterized protein LOC122852103 n=1 Tax=Aphidius gifuensis TaxID=684658 RepID=UPI001CDB9F4B|nr:uncharacterized protein LOC122852103 [Aphidius gifuensis]XP_044007641.1 uncharacterized protein LOC122852103 [Aphidius gifuensis]